MFKLINSVGFFCVYLQIFAIKAQLDKYHTQYNFSYVNAGVNVTDIISFYKIF